MNSSGGDGAEVIYALRNKDTLANSVLKELMLAGQNGRSAYQRRLPNDPSKDYYFIHRNTGVTEPIIVEYGFLDSTKDDVAQLKQNYKKYADAVVKAVADYIGVSYDNNQGVYKVQKGDTLYSIARKFNTTIDELKKLNNLTTTNLSIGQTLLLPTKEESGNYIVQKGDTLYSIALKYGTDVATLKELNNLTSNVLTIGQSLIIPTNTSDIGADEYVVKKGDTLYKIATANGLTVADIINANNLTSNMLSIGQKLIIPKKQTSTNTYTVKAGDTLYSIASKFNTTVPELMNLNNLKTTVLSINQALKVPSNN